MLALGAGAVLITLAAIYSDGWQLAGAIVFGIALLLLYTASTLYHAIQHPVAKGRLKVFDHCAIYVPIAGTYTPFTLIGLRGPWAGACSPRSGPWPWPAWCSLFYTGRFKRLSTAIYVAMGWLVIVAVKPMLASIDGWTLAGCWPAACPTRWAPISTTANRFPIRMRSGTCSSSVAASATSSRSPCRCCSTGPCVARARRAHGRFAPRPR